MKTLKLTTLLIGLAFILGSTSCKYEDGPNISLRTKKSRLAGDWFTQKIIWNDGTETTATSAEVGTHTFNKDGTGSISEDGESVDFTWEFTDKKENVEISYTANGEKFLISYKILRLTNKEFWVDQDDDFGNAEIHFEAK